MTFFIFEITEGILLPFLRAYNISKHLLWGMANKHE